MLQLHLKEFTAMQASEEKTKLFAVAGNPISHSLSPEMMNEAMEATKTEGYYMRIAADSAKEIVGVMKHLGMSGCNITAPFKESIVRELDLYDARVQQIGCSNVVVYKEGRFVGYNTDVNGIFQSLSEFNMDFQARTALIVGYGGAARAAAYTCRMMQMQTYATGKDIQKLEDFAQKTGCIPVEFEKIQEVIDNADVIISTIPREAVLLHRVTFSEQQILLDCSYQNPELEQKVTSRNAFYVDGRRWLLYQGCPSFKIFTDKEAPADTMNQAIREEYEKPDVIALVAASESTLNTISAHLVDFDKCEFIDFAEDAKLSLRKLRKRIKKTNAKTVAVALIAADELRDDDVYDFVSGETFAFWLAGEADLKKDTASLLAQASEVILPIEGKAGAQIASRLKAEIENVL